MYKTFEEFQEKLRPYYGQVNFSKTCSLFKFIEEKEEGLRNDDFLLR